MKQTEQKSFQMKNKIKQKIRRFIIQREISKPKEEKEFIDLKQQVQKESINNERKKFKLKPGNLLGIMLHREK